MKIQRKVTMDTDILAVGDQISIKLPKEFGGKQTATIYKVDNEGVALVVFDNCVTTESIQQDANNSLDFYSTDLGKWLNDEFKEMLPTKIRRRLVSLDQDGHKIRLLTRKEVFGEDENSGNYEDESKYTQLDLMKDRKNRVCSSPAEEYEWWWLMTKRLRDVVSSAHFAYVGSYGDANHYNASYSFGVRPAFAIRLI